MKVVVFDFDGNITKKDTLLEFIKFSRGKCKFYLGFLLYSPMLVAYKVKLYSNWKVKQHIFSYFFKGVSIDEFNEWGENFTEIVDQIIRPRAIAEIKKSIKEGDVVVINSASIENWILPWAKKTGIEIVIATKIEIDSTNKLTGKFLSENCYGKEKVNRLLELFPVREEYELWVYGDSRGDKELIEFAEKGWYNKFK